MIKSIEIYDLDGTLIDSDHRYRNLPDGSIDLPYWRRMATPSNIAKDTLLPLAAQYKAAIANPAVYVIVATARVMEQADLAYLYGKLGKPNHIISRRDDNDARRDYVLKVAGLRRMFNLRQFRACSKVFYDDNILNLQHVAKLGVKCIAC